MNILEEFGHKLLFLVRKLRYLLMPSAYFIDFLVGKKEMTYKFFKNVPKTLLKYTMTVKAADI